MGRRRGGWLVVRFLVWSSGGGAGRGGGGGCAGANTRWGNNDDDVRCSIRDISEVGDTEQRVAGNKVEWRSGIRNRL